MTDVSHAIDVYEQTRQIDFLVIIHDDRRATQNAVAVLDCRESIINIAHIPVKIFQAPMAADMCKESVEHPPFKGVVMLLYLVEGNSLLFRDLVDGEGRGLSGIKPPNGN
jgi:hypothetical protein